MFHDYVWVNGKPRGKSKTDSLQGTVFKIVTDPYGKRISLERFQSGVFVDCVYDSHLFDFRVLISKVESSWQKIDAGKFTLIRDHDDRTIAQEFYHFTDELCTECSIHYPNGPLVAKQKMFYHEGYLSALILFDSLDHPAALKTYHQDGTCLFESWDMSEGKGKEKLESLVIPIPHSETKSY